MAECNWDPNKHGGKPCPIHGSGSNGSKELDYLNDISDEDENDEYTKLDYVNLLIKKGVPADEAESLVDDYFGNEEEPFDDDYDFDKWEDDKQDNSYEQYEQERAEEILDSVDSERFQAILREFEKGNYKDFDDFIDKNYDTGILTNYGEFEISKDNAYIKRAKELFENEPFDDDDDFDYETDDNDVSVDDREIIEEKIKEQIKNNKVKSIGELRQILQRDTKINQLTNNEIAFIVKNIKKRSK